MTRADYKYTRIIRAGPLLPALFSKLPGRRGTVHIQTRHTHASRRLSRRRASERAGGGACVRDLTHTRHTCPGSHVRSHVHRIHLPPQRNAQFHANSGAPSALREGPYVARRATLFFSSSASSFSRPPATHLPAQYRGTPCRVRRAE